MNEQPLQTESEAPVISGSLNQTSVPSTPLPTTSNTENTETPLVTESNAMAEQKRTTGPLTRRRIRRPRFWVPSLIFLAILLFTAFWVLTAFRSAHIGMTSVALNGRTFTVSKQATLIINDNIGFVRIHSGEASLVTVKASVEKDMLGNQANVAYEQNGDTLKISSVGGLLDWLSPSEVALDIAVPPTINIQVQTTGANISVDGVKGQLDLQTATGDIVLNKVNLAGTAKISSTSGSIKFKGQLSTGAHYDVTTDTGSIDVHLSKGTRAHLSAKSTTGTVDTDIVGMRTTSPKTGQEQSGNIGGTNPPSVLNMETGSGKVMLEAD